MSETKPTAGPYTYSGQSGPPKHCYVAQVWDDVGSSVTEIVPTEDPQIATKHAAFIADAFNVLHETGMGPRELANKADAGEKFKTFVHAYLDEHGVPHGDPANQHQIEGCRIGARLDLLFTERDHLAERVKTLEQLISNSDAISECACCGVKLAWRYAGDATDSVEVMTGGKHNCPVSSEDFKNSNFPKGTFRYAESRIKTLESERAGLVASCHEFRDAVLHSRHCLESPCLDGEQTNAVLNQFDDTIGAKLEGTQGA